MNEELERGIASPVLHMGTHVMVESFWRVVNYGDLWSPLLLLAVLIALGYGLASRVRVCLTVGRVAGAIAFLSFVGVRLWVVTRFDADELLATAIRGGVFAGFVVAIIWIVFPIVVLVYGLVTTVLIQPVRCRCAEFVTAWRLHKDERRRIAEENARRRHAEQAAAVPDTDRERAAERAEQVEQERKARIDEARREVIDFYDEHEALLADLPRALFRSQLQNQFPAAIAPEQAWQAAQQMISAMLPLVEKGRDRQRAEQDEQQKRVRRARKIRGQINKLEDRIQRLSRSTVGDPEIVGQEVHAIQEEIRKLENDRRAMESGEDGGMP